MNNRLSQRKLYSDYSPIFTLVSTLATSRMNPMRHLCEMHFIQHLQLGRWLQCDSSGSAACWSRLWSTISTIFVFETWYHDTALSWQSTAIAVPVRCHKHLGICKYYVLTVGITLKRLRYFNMFVVISEEQNEYIKAINHNLIVCSLYKITA